jgi:site-specific recombinase XerC
VLGTLRSPEAQRGYRHAINEFIDWYCSEPRLSLNRTVVLRAETLKGKRDRAIIAVLLGCGLRRREVADLTFDHLQRSLAEEGELSLAESASQASAEFAAKHAARTWLALSVT